MAGNCENVAGECAIDISDAELEARWPEVPWRRALPIHSLEQPSVSGFGCRFCIARFGLKGAEIANLPQTEDDFIRHLLRWHPQRREQIA
jgi:hypothetical protein